MTEAPYKSVHLRIEGRVQGVWYRGWTIDQAVARGLDGWVRNRADGSVEAVVAGPAALVDEMTALCHQGPPLAAVSRVIVESCPAPEQSGFHKKATA